MINMHDAAFQEHAIAQWRDWRRFLTLSLRLIELRAAGPGDEAAFELADSGAEREREIKAQLAAIPADVRELFAQTLEQRRQQVHAALDAERRAAGDPRGHPLDADEVERQALAALLDEAEGAGAQGIGQVPLADSWYEVDAAQLGEVPDETRYRLATSKRLSPARVVMIVVVLLAGGLAIWLTQPDHTRPAGAAAVALVNDQPAEPWAPRALTLLGAQPATLPVIAGAAAPPDSARWQPGAWPLTLCAPGAVLAGVAAVQVLGAADAPARTYALTDTLDAMADLLIGPCDGAGPARAGLLQTAEPPQPLGLGQAARLAQGGSITLRALELIGPGQDPALPPGKAAVIASAEAPASIDVSRLSPALRWPDGSDILPSEVVPGAGSVSLRYLVPLPGAPLAAVQWRVLDPAGGAMLAWQAALDPPPTRGQLLARALADVQARAERGPGDLVRISLAIRNSARGQLALDAADLAASASGHTLAIPPLESLGSALAAGERREITFELALPPGQPLTIALGPFAFEIGE